jgi:hypothetical protein
MGILTALLSRTQTYKKLAILVFAKSLLPREFQVLLMPLEFGCDCDTGPNPLFILFLFLMFARHLPPSSLVNLKSSEYCNWWETLNQVAASNRLAKLKAILQTCFWSLMSDRDEVTSTILRYSDPWAPRWTVLRWWKHNNFGCSSEDQDRN